MLRPFDIGLCVPDLPALPGDRDTVSLPRESCDRLAALAEVTGIKTSIVVFSAWLGFLGCLLDGRSADLVYAAGSGARLLRYRIESPVQQTLRSFLSHLPDPVGLGDGVLSRQFYFGFQLLCSAEHRVRSAEIELCFEPFENRLRILAAQSRADLKTLLAQFFTFLQAALNLSDHPLDELSALPAGQQEWMLAVGRGMETDELRPVIDDIFDKARQYPDSLAVTSAEGTLTFAELESRVHTVAEALRARGVRRGDRVVVALHRRLDLPCALLGVFGAGATFILIDPATPEGPFQAVLNDAEPRVIIGEPELRKRAGGRAFVGTEALMEQESLQSRSRPANPDDLAYIMYTSGSTGRPKGVMVTHRGLANYANFAAATYFEAPGGAALATSIGFDLSLTSLVAPLLAGQRVHLLPGPSGFVELAQLEDSFSVLKVTPTHLSLMRQAGSLARVCTRFRTFVIGGEPLARDLVKEMLSSAPNLRIFNEYGPTETVVGSTVRRVQPQDLSASTIPIGRPINNTQCFVMDKRGQLAPLGWPGELCLGGWGVGPGYFRNPDETDARYIANSQVSVSPLYRTGDIVRWSAEGELIFLGRRDSQIKINGFRVELEGVRAVLLRHPAVADTAICVDTGRSSEAGFMAFIVRKPNASLTESELLTFARTQSPSWAVPDRVRFLDRLPVTLNGKTDMKALEAAMKEAPTNRARPVSIELIRQIWQGVLGDRASSDVVPFFELGGTSLELIQIVTRLNETFHSSLKPMDLFRNSTIASIAAFMIDPGSEPNDAVTTGAAQAARRRRLQRAMSRKG